MVIYISQTCVLTLKILKELSRPLKLKLFGVLLYVQSLAVEERADLLFFIC